MANVQNLEVFAGEDRTLPLAGRDASNVPVNLTGQTVNWYVGRGPNWWSSNQAVISKVATLTTPASGLFSVAVAAGDTQCSEGDFVHEAHATDGSGKITVVCRGRFRIRPTLEP